LPFGALQNVSITVVVTDISADSERISLADIEVYAYIVTGVDTVHTPESTKPASGVDDGEEETVINLTIKEGMKHGWFGNVTGGYGLDGRYEAGAMLNHFFGDNQVTILAGLGSSEKNSLPSTNILVISFPAWVIFPSLSTSTPGSFFNKSSTTELGCVL